MFHRVHEEGSCQIMTTTRTRWTTRKKREEEIHCLRRQNKVAGPTNPQNSKPIHHKRKQSASMIVSLKTRWSQLSSTGTSTMRLNSTQIKLRSTLNVQNLFKITKPPSAFYNLLDRTKQTPLMILVASMCILAIAESCIPCINANTATNRNDNNYPSLDHTHQYHQHNNHHIRHHHRHPSTGRSHNTNDIQELGSKSFSSSSDSFLNKRFERKQQRHRQLLQQDRLKSLIARTSSIQPVPTDQHYRHPLSRQHNLPSQLYATQQHHIVNKDRSLHPLPVHHHHTAFDKLVVSPRETRQHTLLESNNEDDDIFDNSIQIHSELDDFSLDDGYSFSDVTVDDSDSSNVDLDNDDGGIYDFDVDDDEDDADDDKAEDNTDEDQGDDEPMIGSNFGRVRKLAENPTDQQRQFDFRTPKLLKNLLQISHPEQNEINNHQRKALEIQGKEYEHKVMSTTTVSPTPQADMMSRRSRLHAPRISQVPYQLPIVVSISDNSFVSASPIVNSYNADDLSIGNNSITENITSSTTATTTSNNGLDRNTDGVASSVQSGVRSRYLERRRANLGGTYKYESNNDRIMGQKNDDAMAHSSKNNNIVHDAKSGSKSEGQNLLLDNDSSLTTLATLTSNNFDDSLDEVTTMQTHINYRVLGEGDDDDENVDTDGSDEDLVKLNSDDLSPHSTATTISYSHIIASPRNELPSYGRKYWHDSHIASIQMVQEESNGLNRGGINSAIIAILFGIGVTGVLIMIVGVKMRSIRERVAYKGRRRSLVPDTDFLINTIPM